MSKPQSIHQRLGFTDTIFAGPGYHPIPSTHPKHQHGLTVCVRFLLCRRYVKDSAKFYYQNKERFKNEILSGLTVAIAQVWGRGGGGGALLQQMGFDALACLFCLSETRVFAHRRLLGSRVCCLFLCRKSEPARRFVLYFLPRTYYWTFRGPARHGVRLSRRDGCRVCHRDGTIRLVYRGMAIRAR